MNEFIYYFGALAFAASVTAAIFRIVDIIEGVKR